MEELKKMSEKELARRMIKYIKELIELRDVVADFLDSGINADFSKIDLMQSMYKRLKEEIKADAHYVKLLQNRNQSYDLYNLFFSPSLVEASAFGFTSPNNSQINRKLYGSIEEALYSMKKYKRLDEWVAIADREE